MSKKTNTSAAKEKTPDCVTKMAEALEKMQLPPEMLGVAAALADAETETAEGETNVFINDMSSKKGARRQQTVRGLAKHVVLEDGGKGMRVPFKALQMLAAFTMCGAVFQKTSQRSYVEWSTGQLMRASKDLTVNPLDTEIRVVGESEKGALVKVEKMTRKGLSKIEARARRDLKLQDLILKADSV